MRIGVIGCGQMGLPMARAMAGAGLDVRGLDLRPPAEFGDFAPHMHQDPAALADRQVILTIVRDIPQTEAALFGPDGVLTRARGLETLVICSTLSPAFVRGLTARVPDRITLVDAPMSGAPVAAQERRLSFMMGGPAATLDALDPLFRAMGTRFHRFGAFGTGMTAKVLNNLIATSSVAATRAALAYAEALGTDRQAMLDLFHDSSGQTWFGTHFHSIVFAPEGFDPDNTMGILKKDVESLLDALPEGADTRLPQDLIAAITRLTPLD